LKRFVGLAFAVLAVAAVVLAGSASFPWDRLIAR
jgi:hypothetical protein